MERDKTHVQEAPFVFTNIAKGEGVQTSRRALLPADTLFASPRAGAPECRR